MYISSVLPYLYGDLYYEINCKNILINNIKKVLQIIDYINFKKKFSTSFNIEIIIISIIIFIDSIGNGISGVVLPTILDKLGGKSAWIGIIIGIQSFLGVILFLPQVTLINKIGEKITIKIAIFINILVYSFYMIGHPF